jgi:adenylylsulfate kinase
MSHRKATNVTWQEGSVDRQARGNLLGHGAGTVWLTGLPGSGKTTIAVATEAALVQRGVLAYRLDGDNVRHGLCGDLAFSADDRAENIRRAGETAKLFADAGLIVLASFISPYADGRERAAEIHRVASLPFFEIHVECPLAVAEERDPKGLYKKARAGELRGFTGIDAPYEAPTAPALVLRTHEMSLADEVEAIVGLLTEHGVFET